MGWVSMEAGFPRVPGAANFELEVTNFVPGLESSTHQTKVVVFHVDEGLIHFQQNVTGDLLLFKNVTMPGIDAE